MEESDGLDGMKSSNAMLAGFLDEEEKGFYNFKPGFTLANSTLFGQRPRRGRSPVEHRGTVVRHSVRHSVRLPQALSGLKSAHSGLKFTLSGLKSALSGLKSALTDSRPERADLRPERADCRPEWADFRPERA